MTPRTALTCRRRHHQLLRSSPRSRPERDLLRSPLARTLRIARPGGAV